MAESRATTEATARKRKCRVITDDLAHAIDDVRTFFECEAEHRKSRLLNRPVERTTECFGLSTRSVMRVRAQIKSGEEFVDGESRHRDMIAPEGFVAAVQKTIFSMYAAKQHIMLTTLLSTLNEGVATRATTWVWSRSTLHRFMTTWMHFNCGTRCTYYQNLREDAFVATQRVRYIKKLREYRFEGRPIYYQDETWVNKNMTPMQGWTGDAGHGGLKIPSGKGERSIICHVGGADGFVPGVKLIFRGSKSLKDTDYHTEMNASVFLDWIEKKVLPNVPAGSVLVLDRANYHTTLTAASRPTPFTLRKNEIAQWLVDKGIEHEGAATTEDYMKLTRVELAAICKENKPAPIYEVCTLAAKFNCDVLFLPVAHPELNPIEMVWVHLKGFAAKSNSTFALKEVEKLAHQCLDAFDQSQWKKYIEHCIKVEDDYVTVAGDIPVD